MTRSRFSLLLVAVMLLVGSALPAAVRAVTDIYTADAGRGVYGFWEVRDDNLRTQTVIVASRSAGDGPDGSLNKPVVFLWTITWNTDNDKLKRAAFGAASGSKVSVSVPSDLKTGTVTGNVKVYDAVKDEKYTITLDLSWAKTSGQSPLGFDETWTAPPDPEYSTVVHLQADDARDADVTGTIMRGSTDLAGGESKEGYIGDFNEASQTFIYP